MASERRIDAGVRIHAIDAAALGRAWAEEQAELLAGDIPAIAWPDEWPSEWDQEGGPLAKRAARARWAELVVAARDAEQYAAEMRDAEVRAVKLAAALENDLPPGLMVGRDGPRVYLLDRLTGEELTVTSLEHAWKVVQLWQERSH